jgi:hypothetical protein
MTSINTVRMNELKEYVAASRGPGSYTIATERVDNIGGVSKHHRSAFNSNDARKLDNRDMGVQENPGPNHYRVALSPKHSNEQTATFKTKGRLPNLTPSIGNPSPTTYDSQSHSTIGHQYLQGGSPNNVLNLKKAEDKMLSDILFPFLVKDRMPHSKDVLG